MSIVLLSKLYILLIIKLINKILRILDGNLCVPIYHKKILRNLFVHIFIYFIDYIHINLFRLIMINILKQ